MPTSALGAISPRRVALPFDRAHRELGEGRDWLTASWSADVQNLTVTVSRPSEIPTLVHADETARYDLRLPEDGAAVDPDTRNFPVFYREELTPGCAGRAAVAGVILRAAPARASACSNPTAPCWRSASMRRTRWRCWNFCLMDKACDMGYL